MKKPVMKPFEVRKRQLLLDTGRAHALAQGLSAFSLEQVVKMSGISKRTAYRYYGSCDGFMAALIVYDGDIWREWFFDAVREQADTPAKRLLAFFQTLAEWSLSPGYRGCLFAKALCGAEPISEETRYAAQRQADHVRQFLMTHAHKAGISNPASIAEALRFPTMVLLSGAGKAITVNPGGALVTLVHTLLQDGLK
jgi:AcrR family transcriptional regulator